MVWGSGKIKISIVQVHKHEPPLWLHDCQKQEGAQELIPSDLEMDENNQTFSEQERTLNKTSWCDL